jgi:hypothetical protein
MTLATDDGFVACSAGRMIRKGGDKATRRK